MNVNDLIREINESSFDAEVKVCTGLFIRSVESAIWDSEENRITIVTGPPHEAIKPGVVTQV